MFTPKKLGHVVLRVRDMARSEKFYTEALGLRVTGRIPGLMVFLACGDDSHDLALMAVGRDAPAPDPRAVGLYHLAYQVASEEELRRAYRHLKDKGVTILGSVDHGVSEGVYIQDPDGIVIEIAYDRPRDRWPATANPFAGTAPLDLDEAEAR